jgi:multiple sugar transport system permease protein
LLPILQFLLFTAGPFFFSIYASFTDWNSMGDRNFIGLDNYFELFADERFWKALANTFWYMIGIPIGMIWALGLALAFNRTMAGVKVFRVIYYIPVVSSIVAVSILWRWLYNGDYGLINQFLMWGFNIKGPNWMYNAITVKPGITAMMVWKGVGYTALLYLAGLQTLPKSYYEAAVVDGASSWTIFRKITLPLLTPISFFIVITGVIGGAQLFVEPQIMTDFGGPGYSAATIVFYIWEKAFSSADAKGYACAAAWVLAIIIFAVTAIQFKLSPKSDNYLE